MPAEKSANQGRTLVQKNDKENKQKIDPRSRQPGVLLDEQQSRRKTEPMRKYGLKPGVQILRQSDQTATGAKEANQ